MHRPIGRPPSDVEPMFHEMLADLIRRVRDCYDVPLREIARFRVDRKPAKTAFSRLQRAASTKRPLSRLSALAVVANLEAFVASRRSRRSVSPDLRDYAIKRIRESHTNAATTFSAGEFDEFFRASLEFDSVDPGGAIAARCYGLRWSLSKEPKRVSYEDARRFLEELRAQIRENSAIVGTSDVETLLAASVHTVLNRI